MALISLAEKNSGLLALSSSFSKNAVEERVRSIMKARKTSYAVMATVLVIICCATFIFTTTEAAELPFSDTLNETPIAASVSQGDGSGGDSPQNASHENNNFTNAYLTTTTSGIEEPFPGVIAIITNTAEQNREEFRSAQALQMKYGTDKIVHRTWPVLFFTRR
jgi:hypothetical protein